MKPRPDMSSSSSPPAFLTVEEAAALLRVNHKTVRQAIAKAQLPGVIRLGRTIRIELTALVEWARGTPVLHSGEK